MKHVPSANKVLYIFEGMTSPSVEVGFRQFADAYDGDVFFVEYAHDGCAMDLYCQQVYNHAIQGNYYYVDVIGVSIGAETFTAFYTLNSLSYYLLDINFLDINFWSICPFSPKVAHDGLESYMKRFAPILIFVEIALGFLGYIPFIPWDGVWRSPNEIIEQGILAAWGHPLWRMSLRTRDGSFYYIMPSPDYVPSVSKRLIRGIILARDDEFIDNEKVLLNYPHIPVECIDGQHCRLTENDYVRALTRLGLY